MVNGGREKTPSSAKVLQQELLDKTENAVNRLSLNIFPICV
jgi:hypothetical protein